MVHYSKFTLQKKEKVDEPYQAPKQEEKPIHPGVVCDACDKSIYGNRYKCKVCPDYDLCEGCYEKKLHPEHDMAKLTRPNVFRGKCPYAGRNRGVYGNCHRPNQQQFSSLQESLNNIIPNIANNIPVVNNTEQLKHFGEYLKQFLDPFGIDVDYYVDRNSKSEAKKENSVPKESNTESKMKTETSDLLTSELFGSKQNTVPASTSSANLINDEILIPKNASAPQAPVAEVPQEKKQGFKRGQ